MFKKCFIFASSSAHSLGTFVRRKLDPGGPVLTPGHLAVNSRGAVLTSSPTKCPRCGSAAAGKFCNNCGAALHRPSCPSCGASLTPGNKFCQECGSSIGAVTLRAMALAKPWIVAGAVVAIVVLVAVVWTSAARAPAIRPTSPLLSQPDFSLMSPPQRADSLFNAVMWAHSRGNQVDVVSFAPMALEAYGLLGMLSSDARFHIGTIYSVAGPMEMALVQADSLELDVPGHLFGAMLRGSVARVRRDTEELHRVYRAFLDNYESEMAAGRTEYVDHSTSIESFLAQAREAVGSDGGG